ncbi:helix-turn-helix transcriptional regulator [Actinocorallia sp. A-T 12471]|uniref:helix-turn-helix domain-containing protein n=1 Tax=Actinocorallia sp. A-T 12471 TaxID=3089813 RepID=UPI0029CC6837|nr:helix-turn-helix transcriptional regulator [Actinocorallia sp. A-T 12471]MDX6744601.1 helix-turn-helix transcriptional regulator [Actinocorallia sp. A-T 12471]
MGGHGSWRAVREGRLREVEEHPEYARAVRDLDLGDRLREIRIARNLTQAEVAQGAGISQPALSRIELGGGVPTLDMLDRIGRAMGVRFVISLGDADAEEVELRAG